jgi:phosphoribosylanthranilate isomerase
VRTGIDLLKPDIVDVSSAVERTDGCGKDEKKIKDFVGAVIR